MFAPPFPEKTRSHAKAFSPKIPPSKASLKWHYDFTVVGNMWALDLLKDGGSERIAWFGPSLVLLEEAEGNSKIDKNATSYLQTRSISSSSDMESHLDFSTKVFGLSEEEARRQADTEKLIEWSENFTWN